MSEVTRADRIEHAIRTLAWWLVEAQTGFGERDAKGIEEILDGKRDDRIRLLAIPREEPGA